jgi:hypothetical protein
MELETDVGLMEIAVEVIDSSSVERRGPPFDAVNDVALSKQQLGEISAVLSGHAGDQCNVYSHALTSILKTIWPQSVKTKGRGDWYAPIALTIRPNGRRMSLTRFASATVT